MAVAWQVSSEPRKHDSRYFALEVAGVWAGSVRAIADNGVIKSHGEAIWTSGCL